MEIKRAFTANEKASLPAENGAANCGRSLLPALPNVPPARSCSPLLCPYQTGVCAKGSRNNNFAVADVSHRPRAVGMSACQYRDIVNDAARMSACRVVHDVSVLTGTHADGSRAVRHVGNCEVIIA